MLAAALAALLALLLTPKSAPAYPFAVVAESLLSNSGANGTARSPVNCSGLAGGTWVAVPGDGVYGTDGFCIMKYSASNVSGNAVSQAGTAPWVSITQPAAITACSALGSGYHLVSNPEWMTMAANIANTAQNWSGGTVGIGSLSQGNSGGVTAGPCAADSADGNSYFTAGCVSSGTGTFTARRTQFLSNSSVVWDIGGNAYQWINYINTNDKPTPATAAFYEFTAIAGSVTTPKSHLLPQHGLQSWWNNSWDSSQGIGQIYPGANGTGGVLARGSYYDMSASPGSASPFTAWMDASTASTYGTVGFRCAYQPLAAAYHFERSPGITLDSSGNSNTLTVVNHPSYGPGALGQGLTFNGTNYLSIANSASLTPSGNTLTIAAWAKRTTSTTTGYLVGVNANASTSGAVLGIGTGGCSSTQVNLTKYGIVDVCASGAPADTSWHHYAAVLSASGIVIYVDGVQVGTSADATNLNAGSYPSYIGGIGAGGFSGGIDEVRIYNTALRAADVVLLNYSDAAFVSTWKTAITSAGSSTSSQVKLPLLSSGTYNFTVKWGDGNSDTITAYNAAAVTHTYGASGTYTIGITGTFTGFQFNNSGDRAKLISINQWGNLKLGNTTAHFYGAYNMTITANDHLNLSGTTDLSSSFRACYNLTAIPGISGADTAAVTNMSLTFSDAFAFNSDISTWKVSSVTTMLQTFLNAYAFNSSINAWDVSAVTSFSNTFREAHAFNQPLGAWKTSAATTMNAMFYNAYAFNQDINTWDTSHVTDMTYMFYGGSFNKPLNSWNVSAVTSFSLMFRGNANFNQALSNWNTVSVTTMSNMFYGASAFNQDISAWNTANVTDMNYMFNDALAFNQPLNTWNVSAVTNFSYMFSSAWAFNGNISSWNTGAATTMNRMFLSAYNFNQDISTWDVSRVTDMSYMFNSAYTFNQSLNSWNVSAVTNFSYMFSSAYAFNGNISSWNPAAATSLGYMFQSATSFNQSINAWNTASVQYMNHMFNGAQAFNQSLNSWNTGSVSSFKGMFDSAYTFNGNIGSWNTANVTDMSYMFSSAYAFNQDISAWNTAKVATFKQTFYSDVAFNQNIGGWNVGAVIDFTSMFNTARAFNQNLNSWNTAAATTMSGMFANEGAFNGNITSWNTANVTNMSSMFSSAYNFNQSISSWNTAKVANFSSMFNNAFNFDQDLSAWTITAATNVSAMFNTAKLSPTNYDAILNAWSVQAVHTGLAFDAGYSQYTSAASAARSTLTSSKTWTITEWGFFPCVPEAI